MKLILKSKKVWIAAVILLLIVTGIIAAVTITGSDKAGTASKQLSLGEKYLSELDYESAVIAFNEVIKIEPKNVRAYLGGADAYLHLDKQKDAADLLTKGVEATDNSNLKSALIGVEKSIIEGYIAISEAYEAEGWHDKALEILQRVYKETGEEMIGKKLGIIIASKIEFREDYIIQWKDAEFERLIRQYLGKEDGGDIHYDDVKLIEKIEIWGDIIAKQSDAEWDPSWNSLIRMYSEDSFGLSNGENHDKNGAIKTLDDIEHFTSLIRLTVCHQTNLDISALGDTESSECLQRIEHLTLISNNITDISVVSNLIALKTLNLAYNGIKNISPISMLIELTDLHINGNGELSSIDELRGLRKMTNVNLSNFTTADLSIFLAMPELSSLHLMGLGDADYSVLPQLPKLSYLEISCDDEIFQFIKQIKTLNNLRLHGFGTWDNETGNNTGGLTDIAGIGALSSLVNLDLLAPNCYDISPLATLGVETLEIDLPKDCDLTPLKSITSLKTVIVNEHNYDPTLSEGESLLETIKGLLPKVEVKTDKY
ncbi:MAG: hypothetical protein K0S76_1413 [Herbinix sp.]|jgi:tetratricopeptide (TPR) repeat protein|nr:hypothetical protein [Herbinix sp.]